MSDKTKLLYGSSSQILRLDFPSAWTSVPSTVNIEIKDTAGTTLVSSTAATIGFTADTLSAATSSMDTTATLTTGASLIPGDRVYIAASASGRDERATVESYNSSTKTITFTKPLMWDHASSAAVKPLWATYDLDISTTSTYSLNKELAIKWISSGGEPYVPEAAIITRFEFELEDIEKRFSRLYSNEYDYIRSEFSEFEEAAKRRINSRFKSKGFDINNLKDNSVLIDPIIEYICYLANKQAGVDTRQDEIMRALEEYEKLMIQVEESPNWFDDDQDEILDDEERRAMYAPPGRRQYI
jgi:hypothetical protein